VVDGRDVRDVEVVVVGLGVLGSAALHALASDGVDAVGIDQFPLGHGEGSSHGRSRALRFLYHAVEYIELLPPALEGWSALEREAGTQLYWNCGTLFFAQPGNDQLARKVPLAEAHGVELHWLTEREASARFPSFRPTPGADAVFLPRGGMLDADACVAAFQAGARARGAELLAEAAVHPIELGVDRPIVRTARGSFRARHVVVATGAWTRHLLPDAALPVRVTRQGFYTYRPSDPVAVSPDRVPVWCDYDRLWYGFPDHGPGLKVADDNPSAEVDPSAVDRSFDHEEEVRLGAYLRERFPAVKLDLDRAGSGTCLYALTPDDDFVLGSLPGEPVSVAVGLGHAFKFAPVIGRLLADLATTGRARHSIDRFRPDRFAVGAATGW
jgi:sarcosine oxidase